MSIQRLEAVGDGPCVVSYSGLRVTLPGPAALSAEQIAEIYASKGASLFPTAGKGMTLLKARIAMDHWLAWFDMPTPAGADRLFWMVERYTDAVESDLQHLGIDLGVEWRARRWRRLLVAIDALPMASKTNEALHNDIEYAEAAAKARAAQKESAGKEPDEEGGPPLSEWTTTVALLTQMLDVARATQTTLVAVNAPKGKSPKFPNPAPRPWTAHRRVEQVNKVAVHDRLVGLVLPTPPAQ